MRISYRNRLLNYHRLNAGLLNASKPCICKCTPQNHNQTTNPQTTKTTKTTRMARKRENANTETGACSDQEVDEENAGGNNAQEYDEEETLQSTDDEEAPNERKIHARPLAERRRCSCSRRRLCSRACRRDLLEMLLITIMMFWLLNKMYTHFGPMADEYFRVVDFQNGNGDNDGDDYHTLRYS